MPPVPDTTPDWQRAYNFPCCHGVIKQEADDFDVTEVLGFVPTGTGEHDFLWVEKSGANTAWVVEQLARHANVRDVDVGYAGRKDRHAVTRQWISVRRPTGSGTDWEALKIPGVTILEQARHDRKLRRGTHKSNQFRLVVRQLTTHQDEVDAWLETISRHGVPNYFGEQRFGRNDSNMALADALFSGKRMKRNRQNLAVSAARSFLFNKILEARVKDGSWNQGMPGEAFNLEGSNSVFTDDADNADLEDRLARMDIHPTAALWGSGAAACRDAVAELEAGMIANYGEMANGLVKHGAKQARRATRLVVNDLSWEREGDTLTLEFCLRRGGFATVVLREFLR